MTKEQVGEKKGLFCLSFHIDVHHQKKLGQEHKQGSDLEAGSVAKAVKECCLLACYTRLAQFAL